MALIGDASRSACNLAGTAATVEKKARHAKTIGGAARTDLQDMEKKTNKVHLSGGKKKKKTNGEKMSPLFGSFGLAPVAGHTKTIG